MLWKVMVCVVALARGLIACLPLGGGVLGMICSQYRASRYSWRAVVERGQVK